MRRRPTLLVAAVVALHAVATAGGAPFSSAAAGASTPLLDGGAQVFAVAERGERVQTRPVPPPPGPPPCQRVVVVGDSLTDNSHWWLVQGLRDAGLTQFVVDAHPSRRIPASAPAPYSGVKAARSVRATWGEADCWVIALGSNDLARGANNSATVNSLLDEMLAAVSPGARVWWMNVDYHRDPSTSFDFVGATAIFNQRLDARAASNSSLQIIDWYTYAEANLQWFFDPVHVDRTGSIARADQIVAALPR